MLIFLAIVSAAGSLLTLACSVVLISMGNNEWDLLLVVGGFTVAWLGVPGYFTVRFWRQKRHVAVALVLVPWSILNGGVIVLVTGAIGAAAQ